MLEPFTSMPRQLYVQFELQMSYSCENRAGFRVLRPGRARRGQTWFSVLEQKCTDFFFLVPEAFGRYQGSGLASKTAPEHSPPSLLRSLTLGNPSRVKI
jgi:hypothetical protein